VVGDVEDALASEVEIALREVVDGGLAQELIAANAPETAQLSEIAFQDAQATRQLLPVDHRAVPP
jgi:hypothetical protein